MDVLSLEMTVTVVSEVAAWAVATIVKITSLPRCEADGWINRIRDHRPEPLKEIVKGDREMKAEDLLQAVGMRLNEDDMP